MKNYHALLQDILDNGLREPNRTGIDTLTIPGAMLKFDLREGFPAVTTKKLAFKSVVGELIAFLRGCTNEQEFAALGCKVWYENAHSPKWLANPAHSSEFGDLGRIYGAQWRDWQGIADDGAPFSVDQMAVALDTLRNDPSSRRIIVNAWNAAEIDQAALPPCHVLFQLLPRSDGTLHMTMYQRSCDMFLGVPFNIASYALLLELFAAWSGRTAATLTMFLADAHIYENHIEQVKEQLARDPYPLPTLWVDPRQIDKSDSLENLLNMLEPGDAELIGYQHHPAISAPMAV